MAIFGEISAKAGAKHKVGVGNTRVNPGFQSREEPFHGKQGTADQGKGRMRGATQVASPRSINQNQDMGRAPSRGGGAGPQRQPVGVDAINTNQTPQFYTGNSPAVTKGQVRSRPPTGGKPSPGSATAGRPPARGAPPMQKPGKQTGWYSAASRRP